jgi:hypothetical protein
MTSAVITPDSDRYPFITWLPDYPAPVMLRKRFYVNDSNHMEMRTGESTLKDCIIRAAMDSHPDFPVRGLPAGELIRETFSVPGRSRTTLNFLPEFEVRRPGGY